MQTEFRVISDEEITVHAGLVERMALRYNGVRNAEFDDLYQEGSIAVWLKLRVGITPTEDDVKDRVRKWVRHVSREGMGAYDSGLALED